jgi:uncharacterized glyoxalase superfamily protein PhnB
MTTRDADLPPLSPTVWPTVSFADADAGMRALTDVLGFVVTALHRDDASGAVVHGEARWPEGGGVMFGTAGKPGPWGALGAQGMYVSATEAATVDAAWKRVQEAGDRHGLAVVDPLADTDYGSHQFTVRDADGNLWCVGTYLGE